MLRTKTHNYEISYYFLIQKDRRFKMSSLVLRMSKAHVHKKNESQNFVFTFVTESNNTFFKVKKKIIFILKNKKFLIFQILESICSLKYIVLVKKVKSLFVVELRFVIIFL